jgi:hypothetical protein
MLRVKRENHPSMYKRENFPKWSPVSGTCLPLSPLISFSQPAK